MQVTGWERGSGSESAGVEVVQSTCGCLVCLRKESRDDVAVTLLTWPCLSADGEKTESSSSQRRSMRGSKERETAMDTRRDRLVRAQCEEAAGCGDGAAG
jgi:hypothetical protein